MPRLRFHVLLQPFIGHRSADCQRTKRAVGVPACQRTRQRHSRPARWFHRHVRDGLRRRCPRSQRRNRTDGDPCRVPFFPAQPLPLLRFSGTHARHVLSLHGGRHHPLHRHGRCCRSLLPPPAGHSSGRFRFGFRPPRADAVPPGFNRTQRSCDFMKNIVSFPEEQSIF